MATDILALLDELHEIEEEFKDEEEELDDEEEERWLLAAAVV
jgi:hypothetical protein